LGRAREVLWSSTYRVRMGEVGLLLLLRLLLLWLPRKCSAFTCNKDFFFMTTTKAAKAVFSGNAASPTCVEQGGGNKKERKRQKKRNAFVEESNGKGLENSSETHTWPNVRS